MQDEAFKLLCRETVTGKNNAGRLSVDDKRMRLKIISFEEFFHLDLKQPITVELENGRVATLIDCIPLRSGGTTSYYDRRVWSEIIAPNVLILGSEAWRSEWLVRSVTFRFFGSEIALLTTGIINSEFKYTEPSAGTEATDTKLAINQHVVVVDYNKTSILKVRAKEGEVHIFMGASHSAGPLREGIELSPTISIDFDPGLSIHEYLVAVSQTVALFAMSIGQVSRPHDICISPITSAERNQQIEKELYRGDFDARYVWPKQPPDYDHVWIGHAVLQATNEEERAATSACIAAWLNRRAEWRAAYALMSQALRRRGRVDQSRLLNAFAWFEAIPPGERTIEFSPYEVNAIADAAVAEAKRFKDSPDEQRIRTIVSMLSNEALTKRFQRVLPTLRTRFGVQLVSSQLEDDCIRAVRKRGSAAHGGLIGDSEAAFTELHRAICAVECVAFLRTILDLPLSHTAHERFGGHPLMDYLRVPHKLN